MSEGSLLKRSLADGVLRLRLNRPDKRNALNADLVAALSEALEEAALNEAVRVVVLEGEGPDFCAGADLAELEAVTAMGPEESLADAERLGRLLLALRSHPRPVLAAVKGRALAGGCGLATACDLILAREDAEFGYPEIHLGFVPAMVMAILRRKVGESAAFEMVTLGRRLGAAEAARIGLVARVLGKEEFEAGVLALASELASRPPGALALTKSLLYELGDLSLAQGVRRGAEVNVEARMSEECRAGVRAFLSRRSGKPSPGP